MRPAFIQILAVLLVAGSGTSAKILDTLIIKGLSINSQSVIMNNIPLQTKTEFSALDVQKATKALYRLGLFKEIDIYITDETDSAASLVIEVVENSLCESVELTGFKKLKQKDLEEKMTLKKGMVVSDALVFQNVRILKNNYYEEGYLLADIKCDLIKSKVPGNVIAKFTIDEGKKVRVKQITFHGNTKIKTKKIKRKFKTKEKRWFNDGEYKKEEYDRHVDSLLYFYQDLGYLDAKVVKDSIWYADNKRDIYIDIQLSEGIRYYTGDFSFTGNKILETAVLDGQTGAMKKGKPFSKTKFEMTKMFISNAYREEGYLWIQIEDQNQFRGDTIDVTFNITEGRPAIVRKIDIKGNEKTREKVIRRELQVYPGQKYRQSRMERSVREVMQLNYFNNVNPDLRPNDDGTIDLVYMVEEKDNIGQFSAGVMFSQVDKLGGNFSISIPNFRGAGQLLDASIEYSKYRKLFSLGFTEPWAFDTPTKFSVYGFHQIYDNRYYNYNYQSTGVNFGVGRKLKWPDDYFRLDVNYQISYEKNFREYEDNLPNFTILQKGMLSKVGLILSRNDTDVPNFPRRGSILSLRTDIAGLGGNYQFVKGVVNYEWYFPLMWKFVLGMKSKFGIIDGFSDEKKIAWSDLFAAGGVYYEGQIRGYSEGAFGRYRNEGLSMLTFSSELRFPILEQQLYIAGFVDMGNVWNSLGEVDPSDLYPGVGVGFRLMLPMVGLIGFDFAWGLKDPHDPHFGGKPNGFVPHFLMNRGF